MRPVGVAGRLAVGGSAVLVLMLSLGCPQRPEARIAGSIRVGEAPLRVEFHDISWPRGSEITAWDWSFGDGGTSTEPNPVHTYTEPGFHTVRLTVTNGIGPATVNEVDYIEVLPVTLSEGDRVGIVHGVATQDSSTVDDDTLVKSTALFVPGDIEQLTSLGYLGSAYNGTCINLVETLAPDTILLMANDEFLDWIVDDAPGGGCPPKGAIAAPGTSPVPG